MREAQVEATYTLDSQMDVGTLLETLHTLGIGYTLTYLPHSRMPIWRVTLRVDGLLVHPQPHEHHASESDAPDQQEIEL